MLHLVGSMGYDSHSQLELPLSFRLIIVYVLSWVQLFATPWTVACQALLFMEFSRQGYWSGFPFPSPGDLLNPGIEFESLASPELVRGFFTTASSPLGSPGISQEIYLYPLAYVLLPKPFKQAVISLIPTRSVHNGKYKLFLGKIAPG